jgi:NAD(P) transhydrogenase subunit beta
MNSAIYSIVSLVLACGILWGISLMSSPKTAVGGNSLGALCMFAAIAITLINNGILGYQILWICMAIGAVIGCFLAFQVKMIQMPQLVALLNGTGGAASALVALIVLINPAGIDGFSKATGSLALIVGGITFSGSLIAAAKLDQKIDQRPIVLQGHTMWNYLVLILMLIIAVLITFSSGIISLGYPLFTLIMALFFGVLFTIRVGGADMPITISLLNSMSGVAGSITGLAIYDPLLVAVGAIVGASGLLLTQIMCRAMNRSLGEILTGKTSVLVNKKETNRQPVTCGNNPDSLICDVKEKQEILPEKIIKDAQKIVIVPGYGMALAQAQFQVKQLVDLLENSGKDVKFAIHPVAGRMPGHMNVLLAEVDIPYDKLFEMDDINPEFQETDAVIIVGANDVVNPAANTAEGTPIYGMPVLAVDQAKYVIICNFDTKPGYSGVDNPLYESDNALLLVGDAKDTLSQLISKL